MIDINQPLSIRGKNIRNRLFLAPIAGLGNVAFRELVADYGGFGLLFTGMCSANALPTENPEVSTVFRWRKEELEHLVCQIFGSHPGIMARAARRIEDEGFFGVDINLGCSAAAILKRGCGAALLKEPDLACEIVEKVRKAVSIPVFVKFRTGWRDDVSSAVVLAKKIESAGADALVFHPRLAPDRRNRPPKWAYIREVKKAVGVPLFGNGNVFDFSDLKRMCSETACDGVSIGRLALAKPWIFSRWTGNSACGDHLYPECAEKLLTLLCCHFDESLGIKLFKKWIPYFCANFKFGHAVSREFFKCKDITGLKQAVATVLESGIEIRQRPNLNMMI